MPFTEMFGAPRGLIAQKFGALWRRLHPERYRVYRGIILPPRDLRMGGPEYKDDEFFLNSSIAEANRVIRQLEAQPSDLLIDIGSGQGRLPIGLIHESFSLGYLGIDVKRDSIDWCRKYIERRHPAFRFQHVDVVNARYNPSGNALSHDYQLPVGSGEVDIVYMWGVLTNMEPEHLPVYAKEFCRVLRPGGRAFVTAHVEDDVPASSVNPDNYTPYACQGALHARYAAGKSISSTPSAGRG